MEVRLQKYLADAGVASRRKAEELILQGKISVNGKVVTELGHKVDEADTIHFCGKEIKNKEKQTYLMLHKPEEYVTTVKDQFDRPTVMDLIKDVRERVYPIGRLDYDTSGLLLLTNDGELAYKLTHPKHNINKTYIAKVIGTPTENELDAFRKGLVIEDYKTAPAQIEIIKKEGQYSSIKIIIQEGRNRQVRKMCAAIGHPVAALKRVATGKLFLGNLEKGKYRFLTEEEIRYLKQV